MMAGISKTLGLKLGGTFAGLYGVVITTSAYAATEAYEAIELEEHKLELEGTSLMP